MTACWSDALTPDRRGALLETGGKGQTRHASRTQICPSSTMFTVAADEGGSVSLRLCYFRALTVREALPWSQ